MTIGEAVELVIQASSIADNGDIFLLDMGKPVKIDALARQMITMSGLTVKDSENPHGQIEISYVGLRPGEKLYEELLIDGQSIPTDHPRIYKADESGEGLEKFQRSDKFLKSLHPLSAPNEIKTVLKRIMPEYRPSD